MDVEGESAKFVEDGGVSRPSFEGMKHEALGEGVVPARIVLHSDVQHWNVRAA